MSFRASWGHHPVLTQRQRACVTIARSSSSSAIGIHSTPQDHVLGSASPPLAWSLEVPERRYRSRIGRWMAKSVPAAGFRHSHECATPIRRPLPMNRADKVHSSPVGKGGGSTELAWSRWWPLFVPPPPQESASADSSTLSILHWTGVTGPMAWSRRRIVRLPSPVSTCLTSTARAIEWRWWRYPQIASELGAPR